MIDGHAVVDKEAHSLIELCWLQKLQLNGKSAAGSSEDLQEPYT